MPSPPTPASLRRDFICVQAAYFALMLLFLLVKIYAH